MALKGLAGDDTVLIPTNAEPFLVAVKHVATDRQSRTLVVDLEKSVISIEHKLNIARYTAGLIQDMNEEDFLRFRYHYLLNGTHTTDASYKGRCLFTMTDWKEYLLFLTFFLEAFAAAAFSLFDVFGHLMNDLYSLQLSDRDASFHNVVNHSRILGSSIYAFLSSYVPREPAALPWITPLKDVRNVSTHRSITDICRFPSDDGNLFNPPRRPDFVMDRGFFQNQGGDKHLKEFVEECFDGLEEFVEDIYDRLRQEVENNGFLPLP